MKPLELIFFLTVLSFLTLYLVSYITDVNEKYNKYKDFLERFLVGRYLIKMITEGNYSNGICELKSLDFVKDYLNLSSEVKRNFEIIVFYNGNVLKNGSASEFIEFKRYCIFNGSLVKIVIRI